MPRVVNAQATRRRRKRVIKQASGYFGNKSRLYRYAKDAVQRAGKYAYRDRRKRKTEMRQLWIVRINAACRSLDMQYSRFIAGLKLCQINLDRKALSELAIHDSVAFEALVHKAKAALPAAVAA
jgi:large subunit ribosomal protein L20